MRWADFNLPYCTFCGGIPDGDTDVWRIRPADGKWDHNCPGVEQRPDTPEEEEDRHGHRWAQELSRAILRLLRDVAEHHEKYTIQQATDAGLVSGAAHMFLQQIRAEIDSAQYYERWFRTIETEEQNRAALGEIERLMRMDPKKGTREGRILGALSVLVQEFERKAYQE